MLADDLGLDRRGTDLEPLCNMGPETQTVEQRPGTEHAVVPGQPARQVGERIGRIGDHEDCGVRCGLDDLRDQGFVHADIGIEQS